MSIAIAALGLATAPAIHAQATEQTAPTADMTCSLIAEGALSPPIQPVTSGEKRPASFNGKDGTAACSGTIDGQSIDTTSAGSWGVNADSDNPINCGSLTEGITGDGTSKITVTTIDGQQKSHTTSFDFEVVGGAVTISNGLDGAGSFQPTEGDCVTEAMERARVEFEVTTSS
ncbi:hypothetical protein CDO52_18065 [Nocardiopsis gilva YIM 90087]|uniref:Ig-like domain-containing protein n=1 Tax=Nocardiopsis gilva YIM 90087 TaxID=1235441 RepID=A0A223S8P8_9ACTN|nr:hypothetical protein CDO52_18065 [Nocardiopsis gilva YIM 90087]